MNDYELADDIRHIIMVHEAPPLLPLEAQARGISKEQLLLLLKLIAKEWNDGYRMGNLDANRLTIKYLEERDNKES